MRRRYIANACLSLVNDYRKFRKKLTPPLAPYPSISDSVALRTCFTLIGSGICYLFLALVDIGHVLNTQWEFIAYRNIEKHYQMNYKNLALCNSIQSCHVLPNTHNYKIYLAQFEIQFRFACSMFDCPEQIQTSPIKMFSNIRCPY